MRTEPFEPKAFQKKRAKIVLDTEAPVKGFIFPIEFRRAVLEPNQSES